MFSSPLHQHRLCLFSITGSAVKDVLPKPRLILVVDFQPIQLHMNILNNVFEFRAEPLTVRAVLGKMLVTLRLGRKTVCHLGIDYIDKRAPMAAHLRTLAMARRLGMSDLAEPRHPIEQNIDIAGQTVRRTRWSDGYSRSEMREEFLRGFYEMRPGWRHIEALYDPPLSHVAIEIIRMRQAGSLIDNQSPAQERQLSLEARRRQIESNRQVGEFNVSDLFDHAAFLLFGFDFVGHLNSFLLPRYENRTLVMRSPEKRGSGSAEFSVVKLG